LFDRQIDAWNAPAKAYRAVVVFRMERFPVEIRDKSMAVSFLRLQQSLGRARSAALARSTDDPHRHGTSAYGGFHGGALV